MINPNNDEVDLGQVSRKVGRVFSGINYKIFNGILFIKRNILILIALVIAGIALGYYLDRNDDVYKSRIFVMLNFESADYVYSEIENMTIKLRNNDNNFFKNIGIERNGYLSTIEIEPVVDIYGLLNTTPEGLKYENQPESVDFSIFKLLSESEELKLSLTNQITAKNYKKHFITIVTKNTASRKDLVDPILKYLNSNEYYNKIKEQSVKNLDFKIATNDSIIKQIDNVLDGISNSQNRTSGPNLVYFNENTAPDQLLKIKDQLVREQNVNRLNKINYTDVVKENSVIFDMKNYVVTTERMKYILPVVFILAYFFIFAFRSYYRSQMNKRKLIANG